MKRCSTCGVYKPLSEFYIDRAKKDGRSSSCQMCVKARSAAWRTNNPEQHAENMRQWARDNRQRANQLSRESAQRHPETNRIRRRRWRRDNPDKRRDEEQRRRALKANASQGDPQEAAAFVEILREGICELCGSRGPIEIDHIVPLSTGGEHGWENFAGLCKSCNASKRAKPLLQHMLDLA